MLHRVCDSACEASVGGGVQYRDCATSLRDQQRHSNVVGFAVVICVDLAESAAIRDLADHCECTMPYFSIPIDGIGHGKGFELIGIGREYCLIAGIVDQSKGASSLSRVTTQLYLGAS
jgi:hypothetical protein